jgi:adenosylhomocysteine nucleosidase
MPGLPTELHGPPLNLDEQVEVLWQTYKRDPLQAKANLVELDLSKLVSLLESEVNLDLVSYAVTVFSRIDLAYTRRLVAQLDVAKLTSLDHINVNAHYVAQLAQALAHLDVQNARQFLASYKQSDLVRLLKRESGSHNIAELIRCLGIVYLDLGKDVLEQLGPEWAEARISEEKNVAKIADFLEAVSILDRALARWLLTEADQAHIQAKLSKLSKVDELTFAIAAIGRFDANTATELADTITPESISMIFHRQQILSNSLSESEVHQAARQVRQINPDLALSILEAAGLTNVQDKRIITVNLPGNHSDELDVFSEVNMESNEAPVDFAIITALEKEAKAVIARLEKHSIERFEDQDIRTYHTGKIPLEGTDQAYHVVVVLLPRMGNVPAASAVTDTIARWAPHFILMIGIAGGIPQEDLDLGDVIVADQVIGYEYSKVTDERFKPRDRVYPTSTLLLDRVRNFWDESWTKEVGVTRPQNAKRSHSKRFIGPIASGNKVIASARFRDWLLAHWSKLIAVEMEGEGVFAAAFDRPEIPATLVIRGICDMADERKSDEWQEYAANAAAAFTVSFLKSGPVKPRESRRAKQTEDERHSKLETPAETVQSVSSAAPLTTASRDPQLVLKLFEMGRDRTHRTEITFNWTERDSIFHRVFGFALENSTELVPARGIYVRVEFWWQGESPQEAPVIHAPRRHSGWTPGFAKLFGEQEAVLSCRDPEIVCVHKHPVEWGNFEMVFLEPVKGPLLITYTISTLEPTTENQGELRIIFEDNMKVD